MGGWGEGGGGRLTGTSKLGGWGKGVVVDWNFRIGWVGRGGGG